METKFLKDALFGGMTANAFKLGTVLSLGWFWMRPGGCHNVYRGQDGNIDYDNIQAVMELSDSQVSIVNQNLPAGTSWHYIRRRVSDCGLESDDSATCVVAVDSAGDMKGDRPNQPFSLTIEKLSNARFRLRWRYTRLNEETRPTGFKVYMDSGSGFDFDSPVGIISYKLGGGMEFVWVSDPLTDGQEYRFCVRSYRGDLGSELVKNGGFENSQDWAWGEGPFYLWSWQSSGKARFESTPSFGHDKLKQTIAGVAAGRIYMVVYTILSILGVDVTPAIGGEDGGKQTTVGTKTDIITAGRWSRDLEFYADSSASGDYVEIDDVSVKEVLSPDTESDNTDFVAAIADAQGPDAITGLRAEWEEV